jgi:hypothetical protein
MTYQKGTWGKIMKKLKKGKEKKGKKEERGYWKTQDYLFSTSRKQKHLGNVNIGLV